MTKDARWNSHCCWRACCSRHRTQQRLGWFTAVGCAIGIGTMTVAAATMSNGFWAYRVAVTFRCEGGAVSTVIGFAGPGPWSLDAALGWTGVRGYAGGGAALTVRAAGVRTADRAGGCAG